jgi:competence protein ComEC
MIISHPHVDHISGVATVMRRMDVKALLVPPGFGQTAEGERLIAWARRYGSKVRVAKLDEEFSVGELRLKVVGPMSDAWRRYPSCTNNWSLVVLAVWRGRKVLLTGDAGRSVAKWLHQRWRWGEVDVLQVPHHGGGSTGGASHFQPLVRLLSPRVAVYSRRALASVAPEVYQHYRGASAFQFATGDRGALAFLLPDQSEAVLVHPVGGWLFPLPPWEPQGRGAGK